MGTNRSDNLGLYIGTLVIELITGVFRLLFVVIPLLLLFLIILELILSQMEIQLFDVVRLNTDPQYVRDMLLLIGVVALIIAYANIIASVLAYLGFGGGSLMTRFVLGARKPSTRERDTILQVFEQMAEGADSPISSYSKLYVIDSILDYANLVGTTLYVSSASFRGNNLQALLAHEFGHLNNGDGSLILALRRLVFPPFSLFIGGIRDFSTNRPAYRPAVKEFDAIQIFYSMINNIIFFTLAFIGGGIGVWAMSWAWAGYFRARDYVADSFAAGLGYRDLLLRYLEANIYFDTSIPYMLGWHPAAELRIDAMQHPGSYGLPVYDDVAAAAAAGAAFTPLSDMEPESERPAAASEATGQRTSSSNTARNIFIIAIIVIAGYVMLNSWSDIQARAAEIIAEVEEVITNPEATVVAGQVGVEGEDGPAEAATPLPEPFDCTATVSASRDIEQYGSGENCWLKLMDGATASIDFRDEAQITYRTTSGGNDVYFYIANPGDRLTNVVGATIRPMPFVYATYGGLEEVKTFEVQYHSPGGQWVTCLRDVNNDYMELNAECGNEVATDPTPQKLVKSRAEMLVVYDSIYRQDGWCALWDRLIDDGLVNGECPTNVLQFVSEDVTTSNGTANLLTGTQMSASNDIDIYYQTCATFDNNAQYTGGSVEPWVSNDFIGTNTTLHAGSVFTMYFRCDNAWSPPPETTLDSLLEADVLAQIEKLGYDTAADFAEAWDLRIGLDVTNGEVGPEEITTCPLETNGCVQITREKNVNGDVEWPFYAKNPNNCRHDGYRREPGEGGQTGVPPNFEGLLEGVTIRRCQETSTEAADTSTGQVCEGTELGPLAQADHTFQEPVIILQLWRMNGDSPWGSGEVMTVVQNGVTIRGTGGNAWSYPAAECLEVATLHMQDGANLRGSTIVTPEDLRAAGMID